MVKRVFIIVCIFLWVLLGGAFTWAQTSPKNKNPIKFILDENKLLVYNQDQIVMCYQYDDVPFKPYLQKLFTPAGINILRDAPHDHLHHHGLMFAYTINDINFWEELPTSGKELHRQFEEFKIGKKEERPQAWFTEKIDWIDTTKKEVLLQEERTIGAEVLQNPKAVLLTWTSIFALPQGKRKVVLGGAHYNGLGMRFLKSIDQDKTAEFFNADGKDGTVFRGEEKLVRSNWCAFTSYAEGKPVTVAMFDLPSNIRHPATWFTMKKPFAYLSATLAVYEEPMVLHGNEKMTLCYGVAVWDGSAEPGEIEKTYQKWIKDQSQKQEDINS